VIFKNQIRFLLKTGQELVFSNFLSRETCFSIILNLLRTNELLNVEKRQDSLIDLSPQLIVET
jgi:hypothetical protein